MGGGGAKVCFPSYCIFRGGVSLYRAATWPECGAFCSHFAENISVVTGNGGNLLVCGLLHLTWLALIKTLCGHFLSLGDFQDRGKTLACPRRMGGVGEAGNTHTRPIRSLWMRFSDAAGDKRGRCPIHSIQQ